MLLFALQQFVDLRHDFVNDDGLPLILLIPLGIDEEFCADQQAECLGIQLRNQHGVRPLEGSPPILARERIHVAQVGVCEPTCPFRRIFERVADGRRRGAAPMSHQQLAPYSGPCSCKGM